MQLGFDVGQSGGSTYDAVDDHEINVALVGGSGSGKSTVARLICGLDEAWSGQIHFDGRPRVEIPRDVLCNSLALVEQDILLFEGTVRENLTVYARLYGLSAASRRLDSLAEHLDIARFLGRPYGTFSAGQRTRVAVPKSLLNEPEVLLLDEPSLGLAPLVVKRIFEIVKKINTENNTTVFLVEQNARLALKFFNSSSSSARNSRPLFQVSTCRAIKIPMTTRTISPMA